MMKHRVSSAGGPVAAISAPHPVAAKVEEDSDHLVLPDTFYQEAMGEDFEERINATTDATTTEEEASTSSAHLSTETPVPGSKIQPFNRPVCNIYMNCRDENHKNIRPLLAGSR
jgi:hypothetical protein